MHIMGKILAWVSAVLAVLAIVLSSRMTQVRNSWVKKADELRAKQLENRTQLEQKRDQLRGLLSELDRTNAGWDRFWPTGMELVNPANGVMSTTVGSNFGIRDQQTLYVFQPDADRQGGYTFVGPMRVTGLREQQAILTPTWQLRPGEAQQWNYGAGWRLRSMIPSANFSRFNDLEVEATLSAERIQAEVENVATQDQLIAAAQEDLDGRLRELFGNPENAAYREQLPQYLVDGLVVAIRDEEEKRNALLVDVNMLRNQVFDTNQAYLKVQSQNLKLVESLPQPESPTTASLEN